MDARLLEILACPVCKGALQFRRDAQVLVCRADRLAYPIRDSVPVMLEEEGAPARRRRSSARALNGSYRRFFRSRKLFRVVIPARPTPSSRLPGKALRDIAGKPLVQWVYEGEAPRARRAAAEVVIATDDERIARVARGFRAFRWR